MPRLELIYDRDCPNVAAARERVLAAFTVADLQPSWVEWERAAESSPAYARQYGSPTVLVDGRDVAGESPVAGRDCCRLYRDEGGGFRGTPPAEEITKALEAGAGEPPVRKGVWRATAAAPALGFGSMPVLVCPACWPAYAGLLSATGLGFLLETAYLFPIAVAAFGLALFALAWRARHRRGYGPFVVGAVSAVVVLIFKFAYAYEPAVYAGLTGLAGASLWNAWPGAGRSPACPACETRDASGRMHQTP